MEVRERSPGRLAIAGLAVLLLGGAAARVHGLDRSLWLDEAWVANSVLEPSAANEKSAGTARKARFDSPASATTPRTRRSRRGGVVWSHAS